MVLKRLGQIIGYMGLKNEVIYVSGMQPKIQEVTCYFGGDVQNYPEVMESHTHNGKFLQWSILATASLLATKFPMSAILAILPSRLEMKTFSCYDNFVPCDKLGSPTHSPMANSIQHLKLVIENALTTASNNGTNEVPNSTEESCLSLDSIERINLIGFSKGCIVLNQLIREVNTLSICNPDSELLTFWKKVNAIYWLDGAHSGGKDTWVVDKSVLKTLAGCHLDLHVHVTPYQINDDRRPWIKRECKAFVSGLRRAGSNISYRVHFADSLPCIENHFQVLESFRNPGDM